MALIEVERLTKRFAGRRGAPGVTAVDGVSFAVDPGETLGLVGESGCGKSTIGRCLLRLLAPDGGRISLAGTEIQDLSQARLRPLRPRMQMVFQDPLGSMNPAFSVETTLRDALRPLDLGRRAQRARMVELLEDVGLDARLLPRRRSELSGGQLQRVGIARALATRPRFVFLDEPTSALDLSVRGQIVNLLADLQAEHSLAYLFASHDLSVVRFLAHRVVVMYLGRIVETGPAEEVFARPAHPYTQALLQAAETGPSSQLEGGSIRGELSHHPENAGGCRYADRCPFVHERCGVEPELLPVANGHRSRCWLVEAA